MKKSFKEMLDKFIESKYISNIVIIAIIIVIIGILVYKEYKNTNIPDDSNVNIYDNVNIYGNVDIYGDVDVYGNQNNGNNLDDNTETKLLATQLNVITKGKNVGKAIAKKISNDNLFESLKASLEKDEKLDITLDTVISLDLLQIDESVRNSIKSINSKIFNEAGDLVIDNEISARYDRATIAVDTLPESGVYYAMVTITLDNSSSLTYVFKF